jgi:hypothetical protein
LLKLVEGDINHLLRGLLFQVWSFDMGKAEGASLDFFLWNNLKLSYWFGKCESISLGAFSKTFLPSAGMP